MITVRYSGPVSARKRDAADPTPLEDRGVFVLSQLGYHVAFRAGELLAPLGLQTTHYGVLMQLVAQEGSTQQQLADSLGVHRNVMVGLIDELEERALVLRQRDSRDRRAYHIYLTEHAHSVLTDADVAVDNLEQEIFDRFSVQERVRLLEMLKRAAEGAGLSSGIHPGLRRRKKDRK
jgi:DNA-binding MarR family transcriptional regulator